MAKKRDRRYFSDDQKEKILMELDSGQKSLDRVLSEYGITIHYHINRWRKQLQPSKPVLMKSNAKMQDMPRAHVLQKNTFNADSDFTLKTINDLKNLMGQIMVKIHFLESQLLPNGADQHYTQR